ncbi:histidinol-phosphate transaminase [Pleurocapsales cyanobacterium LEGE 06147]|nr:histidinol-phosphate transaminase [Pleurocapsales cyanobacterium LEGE 06147]
MNDRFKFIRTDLAELAGYTPHPGGMLTHPLDRLDTNESPWDLPPQIKEKLAWFYQQEMETNRYPDGTHGALKEAIATYVNESASTNNLITPAQISVGNGSDELIRSLLIATCLGTGGAILVANPTFSMYAIIAQTLGIPVVSVSRPETDFSIDLVAAREAISRSECCRTANRNNPPIRVVFVVHPNSPTANALTPTELDWLRSLPEEILVVIDEAYFEFSRTSVVEELAQRPNWAILRTFSKAFRLAALRVGYAIAHPQLIAVLEKVRLPYNLSGFSQVAALVALEQRHFLLLPLEEILQERKRLCQANFFYLRLKASSPELVSERLARFTQALKARGTLIRHTGGDLRITIGTREENNRTIERFQALLNEENKL